MGSLKRLVVLSAAKVGQTASLLRRFAVYFSLLVASTVLYSAQPSGQKPADVRLLIDISGSMKQNDPNNLRIPALRMVTNLMPKGSEAGVWAFGRYVNMLVPLKQVDQQWQESATAAAGKINSAGLFTNIGDAMAKSSWDWNRPADDETRSMILLTDGMVDIAKDPTKNAAERQRILQEILPRLKAAGVTIHTIALSEQADHELLKALSTQTDGWYQAVNSADELQKVFLKIFEQAAPRDSLPLENNQFTVDASIEEMTILVFREPGSDKAKLILPTAETLSYETKRANVRWFSSNTYDLVTLTNPQPGQWQIDAKVDPDNRVMVVSKLGLQVADLPNNVLANEQIDYQVKLLEEGKVITKPDFLSLVDAKLSTQYKGREGVTPLLKDTSSGTFRQVFFAGEEDGVLEIKLVVKSPTFERSRTHAVNIYGTPVLADVQMSFEQTIPHQVHLKIIEDIVLPSSLSLSGQITYPDDTTQFIAIDDWSKKPSFDVKVFPQGGEYQVQLTAQGESPTGRSFRVDLPALAFEQAPLPGFEPEPVVTEPETPEPETTQPQTPVPEEKAPEPEAEPETTLEPEQPQEPAVDPAESTEQEPEPEPVNWTLWLSIGFVGNVLLVLLGWFVWRSVSKKTKENSDLMTQELFAEDDSSKDQE